MQLDTGMSKQRQRLLMDLRENEMFLELLKGMTDNQIKFLSQEIEQCIILQHQIAKILERLECKYPNTFN